MIIAGNAAGFAPLYAVAIGLLSSFLSPLTELLIARRLPRFGHIPHIRTRITTALLTGALCGVLAMRIGMDWALPAFLVLGVLSVQLARIDLEHHVLPNFLVVALLMAGLALLAVASTISADWLSLVRASAGAVSLFSVYLVLALISPNGIGMGDVKLAAPLGLYLGYMGWTQVFYGAAFGFVLGGLVTTVMLVSKRITGSAETAFGPPMLTAALGTILVMW